MATYTIVSKQITANYGVVQTLTANEIVTGQPFTISGLTGFNGTYTAVACPQYLFTGTDTAGDLVFDSAVLLPNQVLFTLTAADVNARPQPERLRTPLPRHGLVKPTWKIGWVLLLRCRRVMMIC
jgi:hypothetical protein